MGFSEKTSPWLGEFAGIPVYNSKDGNDHEKMLTTLPVPPGRTVEYPYMVKVNGEGEYWVKSDGNTEFYSYKYGRWESAKPTKKDMWYDMTHIG